MKVFDIGFGGWCAMNGETLVLPFATELIEIFYEVDKVVNEWRGRQFGCI